MTARGRSGASQISKVESGTAWRSCVWISAQSRASCGVGPGVIDSFGEGAARTTEGRADGPDGGEYTNASGGLPGACREGARSAREKPPSAGRSGAVR